MRLIAADDAHRRTQSAKIQLHIVHNTEIEVLFGICEEFGKTMFRGGATKETIKEAKDPLFRLRRLTTSLPFHFGHPLMNLVEIRDELKRFESNVNYASGKPHLSRAIQVCENLLIDTSNPIAPTLKTLLMPGTIVVTKSEDLSERVAEFLKFEFPNYLIKSISIGGLKTLDEAKNLVYLCSPTWASYRFRDAPDWRFARDPRALISHFIMYPFGETEISVPGLLSNLTPGGHTRRKITSQTPLIMPHFDVESDAENEWTSEERIIAKRNKGPRDELVSARYLKLAGGYSTFLDTTPGSKIFIVITDSEGKLDVIREEVKDLEANRYIVLKVDRNSKSDFIQEEADRLGAAKHRVSQKRWQVALGQARIREGSATRIDERLRLEHDLHTTGLADWLTNPKRIGPGSESDFVKLCEYLGLEAECDRLWNDLEKIRSYHLTAGSRAARALRGLLEKHNANDPNLQNPGYIIIDRIEQGLGQIGVYRILQVGDEYKVDSSRVEAPELTTEAKTA